jgi:hypothetical protein
MASVPPGGASLADLRGVATRDALVWKNPSGPVPPLLRKDFDLVAYLSDPNSLMAAEGATADPDAPSEDALAAASRGKVNAAALQALQLNQRVGWWDPKTGDLKYNPGSLLPDSAGTYCNSPAIQTAWNLGIRLPAAGTGTLVEFFDGNPTQWGKANSFYDARDLQMQGYLVYGATSGHIVTLVDRPSGDVTLPSGMKVDPVHSWDLDVPIAGVGSASTVLGFGDLARAWQDVSKVNFYYYKRRF